MNKEPIIDIERDEYGNPPGGYESWASIATDRKTNQIVDIWMGGKNVPTRHYTNIPVYIKPNMEVLLYWYPDRLVIREPLPQIATFQFLSQMFGLSEPPNYTERTHVLVQNSKNGGAKCPRLKSKTGPGKKGNAAYGTKRAKRPEMTATSG